MNSDRVSCLFGVHRRLRPTVLASLISVASVSLVADEYIVNGSFEMDHGGEANGSQSTTNLIPPGWTSLGGGGKFSHNVATPGQAPLPNEPVALDGHYLMYVYGSNPALGDGVAQTVNLPKADVYSLSWYDNGEANPGLAMAVYNVAVRDAHGNAVVNISYGTPDFPGWRSKGATFSIPAAGAYSVEFVWGGNGNSGWAAIDSVSFKLRDFGTGGSIPEPSTVGLGAFGFGALLLARRRTAAGQ